MLRIKENQSLKTFNTFGVEAKADYVIEVSTLEELKSAIDFSKDRQLPLCFLGGGSNVLWTQDFHGVVIVLKLKGISENIIDENEVIITANAGENWHALVQYTLSKNYGGLENLSLIPGNVGTAPIQNIGAYGVEIKDVFHSCKVLDLETLESFELSHEECQLGYRDSIFKNAAKGKYVIVEVRLLLTIKSHDLKIDYGAIRSELDRLNIQIPTIQDISKAVIFIRQTKLPDPKTVGNAGSFFKNPSIPIDQFHELEQNFEKIPSFPQGNLMKIPAAWLIEQCGWKGKQEGNVACHHLQPLVIINKTGMATGKEILDFSSKIILSIKEKFGIELEREVNVL